MVDASQIVAGAAIVASDGKHIGTVETVEGFERIRMKRQAATNDGTPDFVPMPWVASADANTIKLNLAAPEVHGTINHEIPAGEETS